MNAIDITLRPSLILKNCLPKNLIVSYQDHNNQSDSQELIKGDERHIFGFTLTKPVTVELTLPYYQPLPIKLDQVKDNVRAIA